MLHPQSSGLVREVLLVLLFSLCDFEVQHEQLLAHPVAEEVADLDHVSDLRDQVPGSLGRLGQLGPRPHL